MPEGVGYGAQNTASVGLGLNVIANHCYGYSGEVAGDGANETDLLSFRSPSNSYIVAWFGFDSVSQSTDDVLFKVKMNGNRVWSFQTLLTPERSETGRQLLIPPGTYVECTSQRKSGSSTPYTYATVVGRIHGKIR